MVGTQKAYHRHDLTARIVHQKLKKLLNHITKEHIFGKVRCYMYTIQWQKGGIPHAHILVWLEEKVYANQVDSIISAELLNPQEDPILYGIVKDQMIHASCGPLNSRSLGMKDGKCSK